MFLHDYLFIEVTFICLQKTDDMMLPAIIITISIRYTTQQYAKHPTHPTKQKKERDFVVKPLSFFVAGMRIELMTSGL